MSDVQATLQAFYATTAPAFCIFTIDKKTEALKVLTELSTDLDDLTDEWDQGRILFALVRVLEPVSQLPKIVLIAWVHTHFCNGPLILFSQ